MAVATSAMLSDLRGQVAGHEVDAVGQVLPGAGDARNCGLAAELAFGADFARDAVTSKRMSSIGPPSC
jgi:hypothetical protein